MTLGELDTSALMAASAAVGAFLGQQVTNRRLRKLITRVWVEKTVEIRARIEALERANGWKARRWFTEETEEEDAR